MRMLLGAAAILLTAAPCAAQTLLPQPFGPGFGIEIMRPFFADDDDLELLDLAGFVTLNLPVGSGRFVVDLPFANLEGSFESSQSIGNVLVGFEAARALTVFQLGVRLPTASNEIANILGFYTDVQRWEAFIPDATSFHFGVQYRGSLETGSGVDVGGAIIAMKPEDGDAEGMINYGAQYVHRPAAFGMTVGLAGRLFATVDDADFAERTFHSLQAQADYTFGKVRPSIGVNLPFDEDFLADVQWVLRLGLQVRTR